MTTRATRPAVPSNATTFSPKTTSTPCARNSSATRSRARPAERAHHVLGSLDQRDAQAPRGEAFGHLKPDVAGADDRRRARTAPFDELDHPPPVAHVPQHEDAFEVAARQRRADGGGARGDDERAVTRLALGPVFDKTQDRFRGQDFERLAAQANVYPVSLAEVIGRVQDEPVERGDQAGDDVRQPARAVRDVAGLLKHGDVEFGRAAPRLHRRRQSRGDAADDDEMFSAQAPARLTLLVIE